MCRNPSNQPQGDQFVDTVKSLRRNTCTAQVTTYSIYQKKPHVWDAPLPWVVKLKIVFELKSSGWRGCAVGWRYGYNCRSCTLHHFVVYCNGNGYGHKNDVLIFVGLFPPPRWYGIELLADNLIHMFILIGTYVYVFIYVHIYMQIRQFICICTDITRCSGTQGNFQQKDIRSAGKFQWFS